VSAQVVDVKGLNLVLQSGGAPLHILHDIAFSLNAGEVAAVVGPSGSGKTSFLMVLGGLERSTSGDVRVAGTALQQSDEDRLALFRRQNLGILFQNFHLIPSMTAEENVALALEIADDKRPWKELRDVSRAALTDVGLANRLDHLPEALSGGEQQRVGLARAMVTRPALLLADEPTGNLDQETGRRIIELMLKLARERGTAILLITHDPNIAARADRRLEMSEGRLRETVGTPA
jgi:putative ABC transport system ATP-binding protein